MASKQIVHRALRHVISFGELSLRDIAFEVSLSSRANLALRQLGRRILLAINGGRIPSQPVQISTSSAFLQRVLNIVLVGAEKQVRRVYAWRIVASVANAHACRDGAVRQNPRYSVGTNTSSLELKSSVFVWINSASPSPALTGLLSLTPEAFGNFHVGIVSQTGWTI